MSGFAAALNEYQEFTQRTAVYPKALAVPYLALGLGDEAGELLEKALLVERKNIPRTREALLAEAGDVLWYLAQLLRHVGFGGTKLGDVWIQSTMVTGDFDASTLHVAAEVSIYASLIQGRVKKFLRDGTAPDEAIFAHATRLLHALNCLVRSCDSTLAVVAAGNKRKLEDRLARDAIKGEGDAR